MQAWLVAIVAVLYVTLLFGVASIGDRRVTGNAAWLTRPNIYALSLSIYCTSWTFFGSVGLASERGLEFLGIYVGPVLVFLFGFPLLRRITRLAKAEKITSIADFLASRYGKSFTVGSVATLIATVGAIPYIALQLKAISGSMRLLVEHQTGAPFSFDPFVSDISLVVAMMLAIFAVLFGTRHADATEHQDGLVLAVAVESVVKLAAFLAIGLLVMYLMFGGPNLVEVMVSSPAVEAAMSYRTSLGTWLVMTMLSGLAIILLPRQFYVTIVENRAESELRHATRVFPLYLIAINLFVLPIALLGLVVVGEGSNSDLYVMSVALFSEHETLAMIAFIGGLSAATAMVIVECVALSIMISNDLVMPIFVRRMILAETVENEDWSQLILNIRRAAIFVILFLAFLYYRESTNSVRLSSIGLLSFAAIAQFAPAFIGGLIWRGANARGATLGMIAGFMVWGYTLLFPSLAPPTLAILQDGPFGIAALRPQSLFGTVAEPLNHGVLWSLAINSLFFFFGSLSRPAVPLERIQAAIFVPREASPIPIPRRFRTAVTMDELKDTISRYLGVERTERSFEAFQEEEARKLAGSDPASMGAIRFSEQLLASVVGSSSARLILSLLFQRHDKSAKDTFRLLDDATEALQHNRDLLQIALDQMEQGITVFDPDFRLICWNRQYKSLFALPADLAEAGVSLDSILRFLARRGDIPADQLVETLNRLTNFGQPWQLDLKTRGLILEIRSNPMPDGGIVATYADISARVAADMAVKQSNELLEQRVESRTAELTRVNAELAQAQMFAEEANLGKTRFLAAAGHDILQPLNAARLYASSLLERAEAGTVKQAAGNIESSLESVEHILGAVLDISRLDAGAMQPKESVFRLGDLLQQIATDFSPLAAAKGIQLVILPCSLAVETDRNLLRRLIQNLVSNAVKYTRTGKVVLGVRRRNGLAEIQVLDTGIGIASEKLNTVFQEFTRLDEGSREAEGLGLGLSIVDRIARVLRLELRIFSSEGRGTRMSVLLPVTEMPATAKIVPAVARAPASASLSGLRVLAVDNDPRILDGMRLLLDGWECEVRTASGSAALAGLDLDDPPEVILADYHLDVETGLDLIQSVRSITGRAIPAILITADRSQDVRSAAESSDIAVINKPLRPAVLRTMLTRLKRMAPAAE